MLIGCKGRGYLNYNKNNNFCRNLSIKEVILLVILSKH